ncbi:MAG TPA: biotin/lipoate A/B protein ligase family protein [Symbiobacteriaceae bacterium]|nr:biotin/lipoate A/B protein ligase family protein [Symbiobacteriaceae bacterium]
MTVIQRAWRLLNTGHKTGPANMAIDEAIQRAHGRGEVPPTLRFYGWTPASVTIGYFQSMAGEVNLAAVKAGGWGAVRRQTGGRMIFHHEELTYSVAIREELLPGGVVETYRELSAGLLAGLQNLGAQPELSGESEDPRRANPGGFNTACFDAPAAYELTVSGRKVAGSAQTRSGGVILQHGSIPFHLDVDLLFSLLNAPADRLEKLKERFRSKAMALDEALGRSVGWDEAVAAFTAGFRDGLGLALTPGSLTPAEEAEAAELLRTKYGSDEWNLKK